jgi:hypothetical protein
MPIDNKYIRKYAKEIIFGLFILGFILFLFGKDFLNDTLAWKKARQENNIIAYEYYLSVHPDGYHFLEAKAMLEAIYFSKVISSNSISDCQDFINKYPNSSNASIVTEKIKSLRFIETKAKNTISSYEQFLNNYPYGIFADSSSYYIKKIIGEREPEFKNLKTVKIIVKENIKSGKGNDTVFVNYSDMLKNLIEIAGFKSVDSLSAADFIVKLDISGQGIYGNYSLAGSIVRGCYLKGSIIIEVPKKFTAKKAFRAEISPPKTITLGEVEEKEGRQLKPWLVYKASSVPGSLYQSLLELMSQAFGLRFLELVAEKFPYKEADDWDFSSDMSRCAGKLLFQKKGNEAISNFINLLDINDDVGQRAKLALQEIGRPAKIPLLNVLSDKSANYSKRRKIIDIFNDYSENSKDYQVIESLIYVVKEDSLRQSAALVLQDLTRESFGSSIEDINKWETWWNKNKTNYNRR